MIVTVAGISHGSQGYFQPGEQVEVYEAEKVEAHRNYNRPAPPFPPVTTASIAADGTVDVPDVSLVADTAYTLRGQSSGAWLGFRSPAA